MRSICWNVRPILSVLTFAQCPLGVTLVCCFLNSKTPNSIVLSKPSAWIAKVSDSILLSSFVEYENSHGAGPITRDDKKYYELTSWELSALWQVIALWSKRIIYDETGDKKRFSFLVESDKLHDFDRANEALRFLGLYLVKEKRLEKLKLVEFHN